MLYITILAQNVKNTTKFENIQHEPITNTFEILKKKHFWQNISVASSIFLRQKVWPISFSGGTFPFNHIKFSIFIIIPFQNNQKISSNASQMHNITEKCTIFILYLVNEMINIQKLNKNVMINTKSVFKGQSNSSEFNKVSFLVRDIVS